MLQMELGYWQVWRVKGIADFPYPHREIRCTPANLSGLAPKQSPLKLAGCPQWRVSPSGGTRANVSGGGTLITGTVRSGMG